MTRFTKQLKTYDLLSSPHDYQSELQNLSYLPPSLIPLRDGEVIIFRRPDSPYWHCRFKRQIFGCPKSNSESKLCFSRSKTRERTDTSFSKS